VVESGDELDMEEQEDAEIEAIVGTEEEVEEEEEIKRLRAARAPGVP